MMKRTIIILLGLTMLWGCKEDSRQVTKQTTAPSTFKKDSVPNSPIRIFNIVHDSTYLINEERLTEINNSLNKSYKEDKAIQKTRNLEGLLNDYKLKRFPRHLAKEFENDDFSKVTQTNVSFISPRSGRTSASIVIAEWYFKDESTAISCFKSLPSYIEREINYKFISWIWARQDNHLFLVSTVDFNVGSEPMQTVKQHLRNVLKKHGEHEVFEMGLKDR